MLSGNPEMEIQKFKVGFKYAELHKLVQGFAASSGNIRGSDSSFCHKRSKRVQ